MTAKKFNERDFKRFKRWAYEAIKNEWSTGFNYYQDSIELRLGESINLHVKGSHDEEHFLGALAQEVVREHDGVSFELLPRMAVFEYKHDWAFPVIESRIKIYDVEQQRYLENKSAYESSGPNILAEGEAKSLVFFTNGKNLVDLARLLLKKSSFFNLDDRGERIMAPLESGQKYEENPDKLDGAYRTPMVITSHTPSIEKRLPEFAPVKKLFKIRGSEELSTYVDKTYDKFVDNCRIRFEGEAIRLGNKAFRDFINFESKV